MIPVSIRQIIKDFGRVRALDQVSVEIERGELFFLLGPSGCGKTTLLRTIAGFYQPTAGRVYFGDRDITDRPPQKRNTGMVFQNYALWPHMTVEANVAFGLKVRHVPRAERGRRVAEALATVRMDKYAKRKPNQLSGGQQQRVALARALVIRPQCLLLDEPLSNLDAKLRLEMRGEIRRLCKESGLTGIYVTHDQKEALSVADRMAVMFDGRIGQVGTPRELYRRPASAEIADFLGETNFLGGRIVGVNGTERTLETLVGPLRAVGDADAATAGARTISIRPEAICVRRTEEPSPCPLPEREGGVERPLPGMEVGVERPLAGMEGGVERPVPGMEGGVERPLAGSEGGSEWPAAGGPGADPEHKAAAPAGSVRENRLDARVEHCVYLGDAAQLTLVVNDVRLRASVVETAARRPYEAGDQVVCSIDPRDVVVLRDE